MIPNVLTVAGSDPSGGAGVQADLKTFSSLGAYGCAVITGLTAQNTQGVRGVFPVPSEFVGLQLRTLLADVRIDACKTGMLGNTQVIEALVQEFEEHPIGPLVVDPVMVAKSGHHLLSPDAVDTLRRRLLPKATLLTPNLPEAAVLLKESVVQDLAGMKRAAQRLCALGAQAVLLKGGHLPSDESPDVYCDKHTLEVLPARRIHTRNSHGTGCTLSAAITARLAMGDGLLDAICYAKVYLGKALEHSDALQVGSGHGPVHHLFSTTTHGPEVLENKA